MSQIKIAKPQHPCEVTLQEIESILEKNNMRIVMAPGGLAMVHYPENKPNTSHRFTISDTENGQLSRSLPRMIDSERLVLVE